VSVASSSVSSPVAMPAVVATALGEAISQVRKSSMKLDTRTNATTTDASSALAAHGYTGLMRSCGAAMLASVAVVVRQQGKA
jgi:hypothetical protein